MVARDALWTPGGVVDAVDARLGMAALLATSGASSLDVATGVVGGPGDPLRVIGTSDVGPMRVSVAAGHFVGSKAASNGPYIGCNDAPSLVDIAAAPASGSRYDRVWIRQRDAQAIVSPDADTAAEVGVTTGVSGTSPTEPSIPTGAVELALVQVNAGATATNGAGVTITDRRKWTGLRGGILVVPQQADLPATGWDGEFAVTLDTFRVWVWRSGAWAWAPWAMGELAHVTSGTGVSAVGATEADIPGLVASITVPSSRKVRITVKGHTMSVTPPTLNQVRVRDGSGSGNAGNQVNYSTTRTNGAGTDEHGFTVIARTTVAAGTTRFRATLQRVGGIDGISVASGAFLTIDDLGPA